MKRKVSLFLALLLTALMVFPAGAGGLSSPDKPAQTAAPVPVLSGGYARANGQIFAETLLQTELATAENALVYVLAWHKDENGTAVAALRFVSRDGKLFGGCMQSNDLLMLSDEAASRFLEGQSDTVKDGRITLSGRGITMFYEEKAAETGMPLILTAQPADQTIHIDETAVFSVTADDAESQPLPVLSYQWQEKRADGEWSNVLFVGSQTREMIVPGRDALDGASYRCIVTDEEGRMVISEAAVLTVLQAETEVAQTGDAPVFLTEPEDVTVRPEEKAVFTVEADRPVRYQWQVLVVGAKDWTETSLSGNQSAELRFTAKQQYDGRSFRCVVTDENGSKSISAAAVLHVEEGAETKESAAVATLQVEDTVAAPDSDAPTVLNDGDFAIVAQPQDVSIESGGIVIFTCLVNREDAHYRWQIQLEEEGEWITIAAEEPDSNTLSFEMMPEDAGHSFRCVVTDAEGREIISDAAKLTLAE